MVIVTLASGCVENSFPEVEAKQSENIVEAPYYEVIGYDTAGRPTLDDLPLSRNEVIQVLEFIERSAILPAEAGSKDSFDRFYSISWHTYDGRMLIEGTYVDQLGRETDEGSSPFELPGISGAFLVEPKEMPRIMDGGCSVLKVYFDIERRELLRFRNFYSPSGGVTNAICNGEA